MAWETFPCSYTFPQNLSWVFKTLWVIIFWVRVTHKILNVNWEKIHSIILSVTCHGFRNFPQLIHIPSYPFMNFQNPGELLFFELESLIKCWMWIGKKIDSIILCVTCHGFRNFAPTHTHPLKTFHEFLKPYELLFFELESLVKCWMWLGIKIHSIILSLTCHGFRNFPLLIHIPSQPFVNFWNPMSYYFLS